VSHAQVLRQNIIGAVGASIGALWALWGLVSDARDLWTAGFAPMEFAAMGAAMFFISVLYTLAKWEARHGFAPGQSSGPWRWPWDRREKALDPRTIFEQPTEPEPSPRPLTHDQLEFRKQLKQFALVYPEKLANAVARARQSLLQVIRSNGTTDERYLYPLLQANHTFRGASYQLKAIRTEASVESPEIDVDELLRLLTAFLGDYQWEMKYLANLAPLGEIDIATLPQVLDWLPVDRDFTNEWDKVRALSEEGRMKRLDTSSMAARQQNWTERSKVNW
jgi:hypothetical protein